MQRLDKFEVNLLLLQQTMITHQLAVQQELGAIKENIARFDERIKQNKGIADEAKSKAEQACKDANTAKTQSAAGAGTGAFALAGTLAKIFGLV